MAPCDPKETIAKLQRQLEQTDAAYLYDMQFGREQIALMRRVIDWCLKHAAARLPDGSVRSALDHRTHVPAEFDDILKHAAADGQPPKLETRLMDCPRLRMGIDPLELCPECKQVGWHDLVPNPKYKLDGENSVEAEQP